MTKTHRLPHRLHFLAAVALVLGMAGGIDAHPPAAVHATGLDPISDPAPYIEAEYSVTLDFSSQSLSVTADFNGLHTDEIYIGFGDYLVYGGSNLTSRISQLKPETPGVSLSPVETGIYRIETGGRESVVVSYRLDPQAVPSDHHLVTLTPTTLHLPGYDFFIRVEEALPAPADDENPELNMSFDLIKSHQVTIENLPADWEFPSTYTRRSANSVLIDDRTGAEVLLSAGRYKKIEVNSGEARITVAFDRALALDVEQYARDFEAILNYYYDIYKHIPEREVLMVVHRRPENLRGFSWSFGGTVKEQNIVNLIGWGPSVPPDRLRKRLLSHLSHEGHHIWFMDAFQLDENVYWWSEGMTDYISQKAPYRLGLLSEEDFRQDLEEKFISYDRLEIKDEMDLVQASLASDPGEAEISLQYDKGALVAYLLDRRLQAQGKTVESLLTDFYQTYALSQKTLNNRELVEYIDGYLGDPSFTQDYVLGTKELPLSELAPGWRYYWIIIEGYLPPAPFPFNLLIPVAAILLLLAAGRRLYRFIGRRVSKP